MGFCFPGPWKKMSHHHLIGLSATVRGECGTVCLCYRKGTPGEDKQLVKKFQVELEIEPKCLCFPGQPSFHYSVFLNPCQFSSLSTYCVHLEECVGRGTRDLDPHSKVSLIPALKAHPHMHTQHLLSQQTGWPHLHPRNPGFFLTFSCSPQHRPIGRKGKNVEKLLLIREEKSLPLKGRRKARRV